MAGNASPALHVGTPEVSARSSGDPSMLSLVFLRHSIDAPARLLKTRSETDYSNRTVRHFGSRLLFGDNGQLIADATTVSMLSGRPLRLCTADGDTNMDFVDIAGRALWSMNAQGTVNRVTYQPLCEGARPMTVTEHPAGGTACLREQMEYASVNAESCNRNLSGKMIFKHDKAGVQHITSVSLTGQKLAWRKRLVRVDVKQPDCSDGEDYLEARSLLLTARQDATGMALEQTNVEGVASRFSYAIDGALSNTRLYRDNFEVNVLDVVERRADGAPLIEMSGNGVLDIYEYATRSMNLVRHRTERPSTHRLGGSMIADLRYTYDAAGNLSTLDDQGAGTGWSTNFAAPALREYHYDTLYRLVSATGRERTSVGGFWSPSFSGSDCRGGTAWSRYSQFYSYDDGGNLTMLEHRGVSGISKRTMNIASQSNRAVRDDGVLTPESDFLSGGLQRKLSNGRLLGWQADNQLGRVLLVARDGGADDTEHYHYSSGGGRTRKITSVQAAGGVRRTITTYTPLCETRERFLCGKATAQKHVVISEVGRCCLVEDRLSDEWCMAYMLIDHLGSIVGETNGEGRVVSREEYAPFGETVGIVEDVLEADGPTRRSYRYSGKEMDASGLYYYGWRYYQPEVGRWLSADPGGIVDGLNLFAMVHNDPINFKDADGFIREKASSYTELAASDNYVDHIAGYVGERLAVGVSELVKTHAAFSANLSVAFSASREGLKFALDAVRHVSAGTATPEMNDAVNDYFPDGLDRRRLAVVESTLKSVDAGLQRYGEEQLVFVKGASEDNEHAVTYVDNRGADKRFSRKTIFMNQLKEHNVYQMTWSVIHEVSHAAKGSIDMWYVNSIDQSPAGSEANFGGALELAVSDQKSLRMSGGEQGASLSPGGQYNRLNNDKYLSGADAGYRVRALMMNADSIALFVYSVNFKLKGPLAGQANKSSEFYLRRRDNLTRRNSV